MTTPRRTSHRPKAKLSSQRGASIIIALLLTLVCVVVAALVTLAASVNAERGRQDYAEQESYYAQRSAAEMVAQHVSNLAATKQGDAYVVYARTAQGEANNTAVLQWAQQSVNTVKGGSTPSTLMLTMSVTEGNDGKDIPDVTVTLSMDRNYGITITTATTGGASYAMPKLLMRCSAGDSLEWATPTVQTGASS